MPTAALIIGAQGGLAQAILHNLIASERYDQCIGVSRGEPGAEPSCSHWLTTDHSEASIAQVCEQLSQMELSIERVFICCGVLHYDDKMPEKRLEDISADYLAHLYQTNAITPVLWLKHLLPLVTGQACRIAVFSARVGSIGDNRLGGWYGYRASKAALNMLLQNCAIEYARRAKTVKLTSFHPGTTDTGLSKPFQSRVPQGKLFNATDVAERLLQLMDNQEADGQLSYLDWAGKEIPW